MDDSSITSTSGLAERLEIALGSNICFVNPKPEIESSIKEASPEDVQLTTQLSEGLFNLIFFWPREKAELEIIFNELARRIAADGAIWGVIPKKKYIQSRGLDFTWEDMQRAALQADLVDNKTVALTEEEYGTRFVIIGSQV